MSGRTHSCLLVALLFVSVVAAASAFAADEGEKLYTEKQMEEETTAAYLSGLAAGRAEPEKCPTLWCPTPQAGNSLEGAGSTGKKPPPGSMSGDPWKGLGGAQSKAWVPNQGIQGYIVVK